MNKSLSLVTIVLLLLGGSAKCRPAQAYLTYQSSIFDVVTTADWQSPSTTLNINQFELVNLDENLMEKWSDCSEPILESSKNTEHYLAVDNTTAINCVQKQFVFAPTQLRTINIKYQLTTVNPMVSDQSALVYFYWNDQVIAWLSFSTIASSWVTLPIPGNELVGTLSIKINGNRVSPLRTQFVIEQVTFARLLMQPSAVINLTNNESEALVFVSHDPSQIPISKMGKITISASDLAESGSLTFWSVDIWGNTETPKTVEFQIITNQIPAPQILWQHYQDNELFLVIQTNLQLEQLISHYQLLIADGFVTSQLHQPWLPVTQALHQSGSLLGLSFPIVSNFHVARVQAIDQVGSVSFASDLILF